MTEDGSIDVDDQMEDPVWEWVMSLSSSTMDEARHEMEVRLPWPKSSGGGSINRSTDKFAESFMRQKGVSRGDGVGGWGIVPDIVSRYSHFRGEEI